MNSATTSNGTAAVTITQGDGSAVTVPRAQIKRLASTGLSLMPEGLETAVTVEQMADLIAFLLLPP